jgi:hypothetical protein
VHPLEHWEKIPPGANRQLDPEEGLIIWGVGVKEGTDENLGSNLGLPQEAEGETNHLPETTSNRLLG